MLYNKGSSADWDNGFLSYWQFKKIPMFVMAAPTIWYIFRALKKSTEDIPIRIMKNDFFGTRSAKAGLPWAGVAMQERFQLNILCY